MVSVCPLCNGIALVAILTITYGGWVIVPLDCFGGNRANYRFHTFTTRWDKHLGDISTHKKGDTHRKEKRLFTQCRIKTFWWYKNLSPWDGKMAWSADSPFLLPWYLCNHPVVNLNFLAACVSVQKYRAM